MWDQFDEFTGAVQDVAESVADATADIRRATVYTQQQYAQTQADIRNRRANDPSMNFFSRTWFYASDQEKMFIVLGIAGVLVAMWPQIEKALK
jgi:uncharacterized protein YoxC